MSQEYNSTLRRSRKARAQRNRPVLLTNSENAAEEQMIQETEPVEEATTPEVESEPTPAQPAKGRRFPNFFSTVEKSEKEDSQKETNVVQARLARATKGKASTATGKTAAVTEEKDASTPKAEEKVTTTSTRPATRPNQGFKTRYILGIAIYLFAANFIGTGITVLLRQWNADVVLTRFDLFGGKVIISTSTVLFLALLIIILVLLARFDLIPRTLSPGGTPPRSGRSGESTPRQPTSAIRQGVKGEDDDLYQEYRLSQRRSKKR